MTEQVKENNPSKRSFVSGKLTTGMTEEEKKTFEGAYLRSKRVLKLQHEYAKKEHARALAYLDNPTKDVSPGFKDWKDAALYTSGYRYAMTIMMELTRT